MTTSNRKKNYRHHHHYTSQKKIYRRRLSYTIHDLMFNSVHSWLLLWRIIYVFVCMCVCVCVCTSLRGLWLSFFILPHYLSPFVCVFCVCVIRSSFDCFSCPRRYHHHHHRRHYNNENEKGSLIHFIFCYKNHHIKQCKS